MESYTVSETDGIRCICSKYYFVFHVLYFTLYPLPRHFSILECPNGHPYLIADVCGLNYV